MILLNLDTSDTHIHNIDAKKCKVDNDSATYLWHCCLGHIGVKRMKKLHVESSSGSLAPGLQHLIATIRYRKREKREKSNREYSSKVLASKELHYICIGICVKGHISGLNCRMPE